MGEKTIEMGRTSNREARVTPPDIVGPNAEGSATSSMEEVRRITETEIAEINCDDWDIRDLKSRYTTTVIKQWKI